MLIVFVDCHGRMALAGADALECAPYEVQAHTRIPFIDRDRII